ncbi:hypothetical protein AAC387_Pa03g3897 [Persea americana]
MASITMTASLIGKANTSDRTSLVHPRVAIVKAMKAEGDFTENTNKVNNNGRRYVMFAAAAAAICCIASGPGNAIATEDPKPGTPEAKKIYAPVCVTMPTARICRK